MKVQPLICRPPLLPGESLPSLLARLAKFNNYEPRSILTSLIRACGIFKYKLGYPSQVSQFRSLETLTSRAVYDLYKATPHAFTNILTLQEDEVEYLELNHDLIVPLLPRHVANNKIRPAAACQFCPQCLQSATFHRLIWLPIACAACLEHKCLLVNACPKCGARIRIQNIVEATCPDCKTDFTEVQAVSVKNDCFGLFTQSVIQSWLMKEVSPISTAYPLPQQKPRDLFRVLDGVRTSIMLVNQDWPLLHYPDIQQHPSGLLPDAKTRILTSYQSYCLYATACKAIIDWPHGFHLFLTAYREREKKSAQHSNVIGNGLGDELGRLYQKWIHKAWEHATLEFVQEAVNQYLVDNHSSLASVTRLRRFRHTPQLAERLRYVTLNEAAKLLGVSPARLKVMISSERLITSQETKGKAEVKLLKREDVLELRNRWEQAISIQEVMNWLGLSKPTVLQLVQIGLLAAQQSHADGYFWSFSVSSVSECLECVVGKAHSYISGASQKRMFSLLEANRKLRFRVGAGGIAFILQEVSENRLRAYLPQNQVLQLGTLLFSRSDLDAYVEAIKVEKGWIGRKEVARILEIGTSTVMSWVRVGLISPVSVGGRTHYFDRQAVEALNSDLVLCAEASAILGVSKTHVGLLVRQGRIEALKGPHTGGSSHFAFSRKSLSQWRSTRVTYKEVIQLLQASPRQIAIWVGQGKLLPENGAQRPCYFSLHTLRAFQEDQDCKKYSQLHTLDESIVTMEEQDK